MKLVFVLVASVIVSPAFAQSATIAVFPATATDANTATPIAAPAVYATPLCDQPATVETIPITNPTQGSWSDPANGARDCIANVSVQLASLAPGTYRGAVKVGAGLYGALSSSFALAAQAGHPCDGTAATTGAVLEGARTLAWCFAGVDVNGAPTTVTSWAVYVDNVRSTVSTGSVTVGATANAAGLRLYTAPLTVVRGARSIQVAGVNGVGEAARSGAFSVTVSPPPGVPAASSLRSIQ